MARIGVIDDTAVVREGVADALKRQDHTVSVFGDACEALESAKAGAFDLIVTDLKMPKLDGIGLLRALGARRGQVLALFLGEAIVLSALGGLLGLGLGIGLAQVLRLGFQALPVHTPWSFVALAETIAVAIGLLAGVAPASRAARLDPVEALRAE